MADLYSRYLRGDSTALPERPPVCAVEHLIDILPSGSGKSTFLRTHLSTQGGDVAQHQQVSHRQEHSQVRAPPVDMDEHRDQARGEAKPAAPVEHPGIGSECVSEKARRASGINPLTVGGLRFPVTLGEVVLFSAAAIRGSE